MAADRTRGRIPKSPPFREGVLRTPMSDYHEIFRKLAPRLVVSLVLVGLGWKMIAGASGGFAALPQLLFAMAILILASIIIGPSLARLIAEPTGSLYDPCERFSEPQPMYGIPESQRKKGLYREAFDGYREIAERYPGEVKPYVEMIDIAVKDLKNPRLAAAVYHRGLQRLEEKDAQNALRRMYEAIVSDIDSPARRPPEDIPLPEDADTRQEHAEREKGNSP